jgi:hypothetical protein
MALRGANGNESARRAATRGLTAAFKSKFPRSVLVVASRTNSCLSFRSGSRPASR